MKTRSVEKIVPALETPEGDGMLVHRAFPARGFTEFDPFLLLDEMGPMEVPPGSHKGFPDHPHRGFETVTYMLAGKFEHRDSRGHAGQLGPGDVQWMTAGSGLMHSEMPEREFLRQGGKLHGFQLWVNLPKRDKMMDPRYQEVPAAKIPEGRSADGNVSVKVIAGEALGAKAVIDTRIPIQFLHFKLAPGASVTHQIPKDENAFVYFVEGSGTVSGTAVKRKEVAILKRDGDSVEIRAAADSAVEALVVAGKPLDEPVARWGPFVMNTKDEICQAVEDFQSGKMGVIQR